MESAADEWRTYARVFETHDFDHVNPGPARDWDLTRSDHPQGQAS